MAPTRCCCLRELRGLGPDFGSTSTRSAIPPLDRDRCGALLPRLGHGLDHGGGAEAIRDVFIFVEDDCELTIERVPGRPVEAPGAERHCRPAQTRPGRFAARPRAGSRVEHSRIGRQAGSTGQPGGRTGDRAGAPERGGRAPRRCGHSGYLRSGRPADGGAARKLDEHPHAAAQDHLRTVPPAGSRPGNRAAQRGRSDHRGRGYGAGQDRHRSVERSAGSSDPQQHGPRHRDAGSPARGGQDVPPEPFIFRPGTPAPTC